MVRIICLQMVNPLSLVMGDHFLEKSVVMWMLLRKLHSIVNNLMCWKCVYREEPAALTTRALLLLVAFEIAWGMFLFLTMLGAACLSDSGFSLTWCSIWLWFLQKLWCLVFLYVLVHMNISIVLVALEIVIHSSLDEICLKLFIFEEICDSRMEFQCLGWLQLTLSTNKIIHTSSHVWRHMHECSTKENSTRFHPWLWLP